MFNSNPPILPQLTTQTPVAAWFKPLAYALTLLRKEGHPCVFYGDLYGIRKNVKKPMEPACKGKLPILTQVRKDFAYGEQQDYFDATNCIGMSKSTFPTQQDNNDNAGFIRYGNARHRSGLACVMSNAGAATKRMYVGPGHINEEWTDVLRLGSTDTPSVIIDKWGYGEFPVDGMSVSVWVDSAAAGRANLHDQLYVSPFVLSPQFPVFYVADWRLG